MFVEEKLHMHKPKNSIDKQKLNKFLTPILPLRHSGCVAFS